MRAKKESEKGLETQNSKNCNHGIWSHHFMANRKGENRSNDVFIFLASKISLNGDCSHEIKTLASWKESYDKPRQYMKKQRHHFAHKGLYNQSYDFSSS